MTQSGLSIFTPRSHHVAALLVQWGVTDQGISWHHWDETQAAGVSSTLFPGTPGSVLMGSLLSHTLLRIFEISSIFEGGFSGFRTI
jgi:hypothetical protein